MENQPIPPTEALKQQAAEEFLTQFRESYPPPQTFKEKLFEKDTTPKELSLTEIAVMSVFTPVITEIEAVRAKEINHSTPGLPETSAFLDEASSERAKDDWKMYMNLARKSGSFEDFMRLGLSAAQKLKGLAEAGVDLTQFQEDLKDSSIKQGKWKKRIYYPVTETEAYRRFVGTR